MRFFKYLCNGRKLATKDCCPIQAVELQEAEVSIIRYVQCTAYKNEVNGKISKSSDLYQLEPVVDESGLLRIKGRLQYADLMVAQKHPIIVLRDHWIAELIIRQAHEVDSKDSDADYVLSVVHENYWKMRSDNGTNFVVANKEISESIRSWNTNPKIQQTMLIRNITWQFNPPAATHMGGIWERMIRTVRKILSSLLNGQTLDDERLSTLMCHVESIINRRPITPVSDQPTDLKALIPNDLLLLGKEFNTLSQFKQEDAYSKRWQHIQLIVDQFWKRWIREYIPLLMLRQKWIEPKRNVSNGDLVLITDDSLPCNLWPLGRVLDTYCGKDGLVRSVKIKARDSTYVRPVNKLCLLEGVN